MEWYLICHFLAGDKVVMSHRNCSNCTTVCCVVWGANGVHATDADIKKWIDNKAEHILQYVPKDGDVYSKDLWIYPTTDEKPSVCPFLASCNGKYSCLIYPKNGEIDLRPEICNTYPGNKKCIQEQMMDTTKANSESFQMNIASFTRKKRR